MAALQIHYTLNEYAAAAEFVEYIINTKYLTAKNVKCSLYLHFINIYSCVFVTWREFN